MARERQARPSVEMVKLLELLVRTGPVDFEYWHVAFENWKCRVVTWWISSPFWEPQLRFGHSTAVPLLIMAVFCFCGSYLKTHIVFLITAFERPESCLIGFCVLHNTSQWQQLVFSDLYQRQNIHTGHMNPNPILFPRHYSTSVS